MVAGLNIEPLHDRLPPAAGHMSRGSEVLLRAFVPSASKEEDVLHLKYRCVVAQKRLHDTLAASRGGSFRGVKLPSDASPLWSSLQLCADNLHSASLSCKTRGRRMRPGTKRVQLRDAVRPETPHTGALCAKRVRTFLIHEFVKVRVRHGWSVCTHAAVVPVVGVQAAPRCGRASMPDGFLATCCWL